MRGSPTPTLVSMFFAIALAPTAVAISIHTAFAVAWPNV
jgi:hypothetical protein